MHLQLVTLYLHFLFARDTRSQLPGYLSATKLQVVTLTSQSVSLVEQAIAFFPKPDRLVPPLVEGP
ncbi:MAG: hypothetical protein ABSG03_30825 [Bryobacteraceae bacterium]|jgi:hypothetical protein